MPRTAIYARYSSDRQNERSVDDQVRLCVQRAEREGWELGPVFADYAISGATRDRPQLNSMLAATGDFDILIAESLDRISRDQEDIANIFKRLRFAGVRIVTLADGDVSEIHIGLKGTMSALFLKDLGDKTRRGQIGNVHAGRIPGGKAYGYRPEPRIDGRGNVERGWFVIDDDQAAVVRRIFDEYLQGRSPRAIATDLNREGIAAPRGGLWRANTITGSRARRNGIIHNQLYAGVIVFNRQRFDKDPESRKRVSRLNEAGQWVTGEAEALRIVDAATWAAVQARIEGAAYHPAHRQRRPQRLLSGVVQCGVCGGSVIVVGADRWGCSTRRETGTCSNNRTISTRLLETRVLGAMKQHLLTPEFVEDFIDEWQRGTAAMQRTRRDRMAKLERQRHRLKARVGRLLDAIGDGLGDYAAAKSHVVEAHQQLDAIEHEIADAAVADTIEILPGIGQTYRRYIETIETGLAAGGSNYDEFRAELRAMIGKVVMTPNTEGRGATLELHGILAAILKAGTNGDPQGGSCMFTVVAGAGLSRWHTYRLIAAA